MKSFSFTEWQETYNKFSSLPRVADITIVFSEYACDPEYELVKRSWKERLFSRPWEPRRKYKQVMTAINPQMYKMNTTGGEIIVAHPSFREQLRHLTTHATDSGYLAALQQRDPLEYKRQTLGDWGKHAATADD